MSQEAVRDAQQIKNVRAPVLGLAELIADRGDRLRGFGDLDFQIPSKGEFDDGLFQIATAKAFFTTEPQHMRLLGGKY